MNAESRIWVAGADTLVGAALLRELGRLGYANALGFLPDFVDAADVRQQVCDNRVEYVFLAAGLCGGIHLNQERPADLMTDNLRTVLNILEAAREAQCRRLLYIASACCYPRLCPQPMHEDYLLSGPWEPTNTHYSAAKVAGWKLCDAYRRQHGLECITAIPTNAYGPGDDFEPGSAHVAAGMMARMHEAKTAGDPEFVVWGTGRAQREFMHAADVANACIFLMRQCTDAGPVNIGGGETVSIAELAEIIREVTGYAGRLAFDATKPDGMPLKALDASRLLNMGWRPQTALRDGLAETYGWYRTEWLS